MYSDTRSRGLRLGKDGLTVPSGQSNAASVRGPRRWIHFRRLAEKAWVRRRLQNLSSRHSEFEALRNRLSELEALLRQAGYESSVEEEQRFQRAALGKAIEVHGDCSKTAQEHAARLGELESGRSAAGLLTETTLQLSSLSQAKGLMSYAPGYLYVFQRTVAGLQFTAQPVDEVQAYALLEELAADETAFGRLETTTRVRVCRAEILASRDRIRIEVDHEGFWVSVELKAGGGRATYENPLPRFEDAQHFVSDSLRDDLLAGLRLGDDWRRSGDPYLPALDSLEPGRPKHAASATSGSRASDSLSSTDRSSQEEVSDEQAPVRTLWSMLMAVPGYRSVFQEGVSDPAGKL